jgi:hypothetical protein
MRRSRIALATLCVLLPALLGAALAQAEPALPSVYARYVLRRPGQASEQLLLVRTERRIEHRFVERGIHEIWQRDRQGELEHVKAFGREGKSVHYTAGDLRTIALAPSWDELASLIGRPARAGLRQTEKRSRVRNRDARLLTGMLGGLAARVHWLDEPSLPAKIEIAGQKGLSLELVDLTVCTETLCSPQTEEGLRSLEFADLGDMHYDPFVRRFLAREQALGLVHAVHAH